MTAATQAETQPGHYIQANGLNIYYEEQGQGRPLLLIHGGLLTGRSWSQYLAAFAEHYRVITPDSRGHGRTANPTGMISYRLLADDIAALVEGLGLEKPLICGYSDGGQAALELGIHYPNLPQALILGGTQLRLSQESITWVRSILGDEQSPEVDTEQFERNDSDFAAMLKRIHGADNWKTLLKQIKPMWNSPINYTQDDLARVVAPTLVLLGDRDGFTMVEEAGEMARLLANAELTVIPGSEHTDLIFSPAKVALARAMMLDFLLQHS
jgi:pimeloyl-ACP methyl ester carboxylesterase